MRLPSMVYVRAGNVAYFWVFFMEKSLGCASDFFSQMNLNNAFWLHLWFSFFFYSTVLLMPHATDLLKVFRAFSNDSPSFFIFCRLILHFFCSNSVFSTFFSISISYLFVWFFFYLTATFMWNFTASCRAFQTLML